MFQWLAEGCSFLDVHLLISVPLSDNIIANDFSLRMNARLDCQFALIKMQRLFWSWIMIFTFISLSKAFLFSERFNRNCECNPIGWCSVDQAKCSILAIKHLGNCFRGSSKDFCLLRRFSNGVSFNRVFHRNALSDLRNVIIKLQEQNKKLKFPCVSCTEEAIRKCNHRRTSDLNASHLRFAFHFVRVTNLWPNKKSQIAASFEIWHHEQREHRIRSPKISFLFYPGKAVEDWCVRVFKRNWVWLAAQNALYARCNSISDLTASVWCVFNRIQREIELHAYV